MAIIDFIEEGKEVNNHFHDENPISLEVFEKTYNQVEDEFYYEWVDGRALKTYRDMNRQQYLIIRNIQRFFYKLNAKKEILGELISEGDNFFNGNRRRPDMAFYTNEQLNNTFEGEKDVPEFVIEIVSENDAWNYYMHKREDYLKAGVKVMWIITPAVQNVVIFRLENVVEVVENDGICSANEVIEGFNISVNDIFKLLE